MLSGSRAHSAFKLDRRRHQSLKRCAIRTISPMNLESMLAHFHEVLLHLAGELRIGFRELVHDT